MKFSGKINFSKIISLIQFIIQEVGKSYINVWTFGDNRLKQLGLKLDNISNRNVSTQIPNLKGEKVSTGLFHTIIMRIKVT